MKLNKRNVAIRQLDSAIRLLFNAGDVVSVHTLASAASTIFRNLLTAAGQETWRAAIIDGYPGREKDAIELLNRAQNFFKHADVDPDGELDFDESENDQVIIVATMEYGKLIEREKTKLSPPMSMFQMWYFAKDPRLFENIENQSVRAIVETSQKLFPELIKFPRFQQLAIGSQALRNWEHYKRKRLNVR